MTSYNIAVTVGPNIFRPKTERQDDIITHGVYYDAMIKMIENYETIFGDQLQYENLRLGAVGSTQTSDLKEILSREASTYNTSEVIEEEYEGTEDSDAIFEQMAEADEEALKR